MSMKGFGSDDLPPQAHADDDKQQWAARVIQKSYRGFQQSRSAIHANMASPTQTAMMQQRQQQQQFGYTGTPQEDHAASVIQRNFRKNVSKLGGGGKASLHGYTGNAAAAEALHPHTHHHTNHHQQQQQPYNNNYNNGYPTTMQQQQQQQHQQQYQQPPATTFWQPGMQVTPARPTNPFPNKEQHQLQLQQSTASAGQSRAPPAAPLPKDGGCCSLVCNGGPLWPTGYHPNLQKWHLHQLSAPLSEPCCCCFAMVCPCYYAYDMRSRVLKGHYELYKCCQGTVTDVDLYSASCPRLCLMFESCCCTYCAVIATRELLGHQRKMLADPTDNKIQRFSNCLSDQRLCCSMCCSQVDKAQWQHTARLLDERRGLHVCAKLLQCFLMPCLQVQTWAQLDVPVHTPVNQMAFPQQQQQQLQQQMMSSPQMMMKPAWESPQRQNHRRPGGYLDEPKVQHTSKFKRRHNKVYPLSETHPMAPHIPAEVVGRRPKSPDHHGHDDGRVESPDEALEAAAIRAAWSTAAVNQHAGHTPRRPADGRSPLNMSRQELDEIDAYNAIHNPNLSPTYNRSRSAGRTPGTRGTRHGSIITEQPTSERRHLNFKDTVPLDAAGISKAPDSPFTQYQKNKVLEDARRHGEDLLSGHVKPTYSTTAESLSHLPTDQITPDRVDRGKRRHKAEVDSASAYGASSLSRFAAIGNDSDDDDAGAGAAMERIEEHNVLRAEQSPPPPPPPAREGMIRRGDGKAARKERDAANDGAAQHTKSGHHHSSHSNSKSKSKSKSSSPSRHRDGNNNTTSTSTSNSRKSSNAGEAGYTPVRSVSQHGRTSGLSQEEGQQQQQPAVQRTKKKKPKKPRPPSMTKDAASKILTGATGGWTQTARNASYSRGHAPDSERAQQFKNEYKSLKDKAYNRGQAL